MKGKTKIKTEELIVFVIVLIGFLLSICELLNLLHTPQWMRLLLTGIPLIYFIIRLFKMAKKI